jgi:hypothetical protein
MAMVGSGKEEEARRNGGKKATKERRLRRWRRGGGGDIWLGERRLGEKRERWLYRPLWREEGEWKGERGREGSEEV